jgi:addiction module HigA family antidote
MEEKAVTRLANVHPGEVLLEEFLRPMGITAYRLAKETGVPQTRISQVIRGKRGVSAETALRLARFFGTTAQFWLGLQNDYDLEESERALHKDLQRIRTWTGSTVSSPA